MRRTLVLVVLATALLWGGNQDETRIAQLQSQIDSLAAQSEEKDRTINEFFSSLSDIEQNLALIKQKEQSIGADVKMKQTGEIAGDDRERISQEIIAINEIMAKNRSTIASLTKKLKKSNLQVAEFERMLQAAQRNIEERDSMVNRLKLNLETLNFSVDSLNLVVTNLDSTNRQLSDRVSQQHAALNEAWYAFGSKKELVENGVITSSGGFLGIGKSNELKSDFDTSYFTRVSIEETDEIPIYATKKGVQIITSHPTGSYELVQNAQGAVEKIKILNRDQFWRASRYLVVVIK